jgi:hypothetical protein
MKKASTFSAIHTQRLQHLQTSLSRCGVLLSLRLQRTGDKTYMQNFSEKNVGKGPHKGWRIVEDGTAVFRSSGLCGARGGLESGPPKRSSVL